MKKLVVVIAVGLAILGGAAWAYSWGDRLQTSGWAEPADYTYRVQYTVFGPAMGTYDITVWDHKVTDVHQFPDTYDRGGEEWITVENAWTLADLVDKYIRAKDSRDSDARIDYDSATGAPATISIDWVVYAVDDEETFAILAFDPVFLDSTT